MTPHAEPSNFTPAQREGLGTRRADQDRTLDGIHRLEASLGSAAPGREPQWLRDVLGSLEHLVEAMREEQRNAERPDSLLSDVSRTQPRLRNRVRGIRAQYGQVRDAVDALCHELTARSEEPGADVADIRQRLGWVLTMLRHQRSRESDLIYEAYYDAFNTDLDVDRADERGGEAH